MLLYIFATGRNARSALLGMIGFGDIMFMVDQEGSVVIIDPFE